MEWKRHVSLAEEFNDLHSGYATMFQARIGRAGQMLNCLIQVLRTHPAAAKGYSSEARERIPNRESRTPSAR
jgi:hypothetical protein